MGGKRRASLDRTGRTGSGGSANLRGGFARICYLAPEALGTSRMAIENELKYVLSNGDELEALLSRTMVPQRLEQAYLDNNARIRCVDDTIRLFTYKHRLADGSSVEIETAIDARSFDLLWRECGSGLRKHRYKLRDGEILWDVDFFKSGSSGQNYFAMAEAEMPEGMSSPADIHPVVRKHLLFAVPRHDRRFSSFRLTDENYARSLAAELMDAC
jgi:CYTH domain-containing protein